MSRYGVYGKKRFKRFFLVACCIAALMTAAGCSVSDNGAGAKPAVESETAVEQAEPAAENEESAAQNEAAAEQSDAAQDILQVDALKVGKADAIVLRCGGETMVIDCGEDEDGEEVLDFLADNGVRKVDVLLITHYDKDHVGGADKVVEGIEVGRVLVSAYIGTSKQYEEFIAALQSADIAAEQVEQTTKLNLGSAAVTVEPPASYEMPDDGEEYDNNFSLITTVEFGTRRMVFAGDIEKERIREWLDGGTAQECDVLKVPHHGQYTSALKDLFKTLQPEYAVICDSEKNPAADKTLELLKECGAQYFETKDGDIAIICDGNAIEIRQ